MKLNFNLKNYLKNTLFIAGVFILFECSADSSEEETNPPEKRTESVMIISSSQSLEMASSGTSSYEIRLSDSPAPDKILRINITTDTSLSVSPASHDFTSGNWYHPVAIQVTHTGAASSTNQMFMINHSVDASPSNADDLSRVTMDYALAVTVAPPPFVSVCDRTPNVINEILRNNHIVAPIRASLAPGASLCAAITADHLAMITMFDLADGGFGSSGAITQLQIGDFDNLTSLTTLFLAGNDLTTLPAGIFDDLTSLRVLDLGENVNLSSLPAGIFSSLTSLEDDGLGLLDTELSCTTANYTLWGLANTDACSD